MFYKEKSSQFLSGRVDFEVDLLRSSIYSSGMSRRVLGYSLCKWTNLNMSVGGGSLSGEWGWEGGPQRNTFEQVQ